MKGGWDMEEIPKLTSKDLEDLFGVDRTTIFNWRKKGMPHYQIGRNIRFKKEEVVAWVEKHKVNK
jgi:excisionase family DNA binding protein